MTSADNFNLAAFLPYRLNQAAEAASRAFQAVYRERYGMTRTEWRVLVHLGQFGTLTARDICERAVLHKTKVSRAVFALEKRRWLTRKEDSADRRIEHLTLTPKGRAVFRDLGAAATAHDERIRQSLGGRDHALLLRLLDKVSQSGCQTSTPAID